MDTGGDPGAAAPPPIELVVVTRPRRNQPVVPREGARLKEKEEVDIIAPCLEDVFVHFCWIRTGPILLICL